MDELTQLLLEARKNIVVAEQDLNEAKATKNQDFIIACLNNLVELRKNENLLLERQAASVAPQPISAAPTAFNSSQIIECLNKALDEREERTSQKTLAFSTCSNSSLNSFLSLLKIDIVVGETSEIETPSARKFTPFIWTQDEEQDTPKALEHLKGQLIDFGAPIGQEHRKYSLFDVHGKTNILGLNDSKTGNLKGGTDIIIAPYPIAEEAVVMQSCITIELKTMKRTEENSIDKWFPQATLELIASCYHSKQNPLVLLTDLNNNAVIFKMVFDSTFETFHVVRYTLSLEQAMSMLVNHLKQNCTNTLTMPYDHPSRPCVEAIKAFKKQRQSSLDDSIVWEQFQDMLQDSEPGTRERALAIKTFYSACDFNEPSFISMYV